LGGVILAIESMKVKGCVGVVILAIESMKVKGCVGVVILTIESMKVRGLCGTRHPRERGDPAFDLESSTKAMDTRVRGYDEQCIF